MKLYAEISKSEELDDGTIKVWGYASSEVTDSDGEVIQANAIKAALPDYMKFGAVREMHQAKAAGTAIEAKVEDDGRTFFGAHVVDSEAVKKVKAGVYKGFSVGGKVTKRDEMNKSLITGINLVEISLVDRPANPEAVFTMYKADVVESKTTAVDELADLLNKGEITPEALLDFAKSKKEPAPVVNSTEENTEGNTSTEQSDAEKAVKIEALKKGMYSVASFADLLSSISCLADGSEWESQIEGDNSPVPQQLRDWLAQGIEIFKAMTEEETSEMMADLQAMVPEVDPAMQTIEQGDKTGNLAKSGARFSKDTKEKLAKAHQAVKDASEHLNAIGYDDDGQNDNDGDDAGKSAVSEGLSKVMGELDAVKSELTKISSERDAMEKRIKELEAQPAPGKALLKAITVDKTADTGDQTLSKGQTNSDANLVKDSKGAVDEVASLIKSIHSKGGVVVR
jgi:phage head maturation protease